MLEIGVREKSPSGGLPRGEWHDKVWCISNASGQWITRLVRHSLFFLETWFNQGLSADSLIYYGKISLLHSVACLFQFSTLPFGLFGAPATFQDLMDRVLHPHAAYAAYLDDAIIHKWHLAAACAAGGTGLDSLSLAGLRPTQRSVQLDGGGGTVFGVPFRPPCGKDRGYRSLSIAWDQKAGEAFLGLAGYYRQFIPAFSELTMTDLTRKGASDLVQWTWAVSDGVSWTGCCIRALNMLLPTLMMPLFIVTPDTICSRRRWGLSHWGWWSSRPTQTSVQLDWGGMVLGFHLGNLVEKKGVKAISGTGWLL